MKYDLLNNIISNYKDNITKIKTKYLELLSELTVIEDIQDELFVNSVHEIHNNRGYIIICYANEPNEDTFEIIGSGTILIERKIIRGCRSVGHIEDIVVKEKYRGNNLSQTILDLLQEYAIKQNCYKVILDCKRSVKKVYEKNNFVEKDIQMVKYL